MVSFSSIEWFLVWFGPLGESRGGLPEGQLYRNGRRLTSMAKINGSLDPIDSWNTRLCLPLISKDHLKLDIMVKFAFWGHFYGFMLFLAELPVF